MRTSLLLALACVLAAPVATLAASPNELRSAAVSPSSGSTTTTFTFSVAYVSAKAFAETSVTALVAGRSVSLKRVAGSVTNGTYRGSSRLPAGRWPVTFTAEAVQGPSPSLQGPTLVVTAPKPAPTARPTASPTPKPQPTQAPPRATQTSASTPKPEQPVAPVPPPATRTPTGSPSVAPATASLAPSTPADASPSDVPVAVAGPLNRSGDGGPNLPLVAAIVVAVVAGLAASWWFIARRRHQPEESAAPSRPLERDARMAEPARRVLRPPTPAASDDPILASMGLGPSPSGPLEPPHGPSSNVVRLSERHSEASKRRAS